MNGCQHVSISFTPTLKRVSLFIDSSVLMEADVVTWLQYLRHTVDEEFEVEQHNLISVYCDSLLVNSTINTLYDFDLTASVSDFECYSMDDQHPDDKLSSTFVEDDQQKSLFKAFSKNDIFVSIKPNWSDVQAWKTYLMDSALDSTTSEDEQWFSSKDFEGRSYYFEENSNESSWTLPETRNNKVSNTTATTPEEDSSLSLKLNESNCEKNNSDLRSPLSPQINVNRNWPQLWDGNMCVLKEGPLNRTKMTENGKRLRKNWTTSHVILTELFLLFFKDAKSFIAMKNGNGRPELCIDLNGALVDTADKLSSRKNVYVISTVLGTQVLFQNECNDQAQMWLNAIQAAIANLPCSFDRCPRISSKQTKDSLDADKKIKLNRNKSVKLKVKDGGSMEDLTSTNVERQTKIKARLRKFFHRRPTMESLVKKGIWKDEPAFGCLLEHVVGTDQPRIPEFVQRCVAAIERSEENLKTDGLYRASGNLSQVQKIRLQVDQNNLSVIDQEEDVHVLTGVLKLFFRELKEPLIPYNALSSAISAGTSHIRKDKLLHLRGITKLLPRPNYDTLKFLLKHLLKVTSYKEFNRMQIPNLAIVFGPTLMWPKEVSTNMAIDLMQQNMVIEALLIDFDNIFR